MHIHAQASANQLDICCQPNGTIIPRWTTRGNRRDELFNSKSSSPNLSPSMYSNTQPVQQQQHPQLFVAVLSIILVHRSPILMWEIYSTSLRRTRDTTYTRSTYRIHSRYGGPIPRSSRRWVPHAREAGGSIPVRDGHRSIKQSSSRYEVPARTCVYSDDPV